MKSPKRPTFASYRNHVVHISIYSTVGALCLQQANAKSELLTTSFWYLSAGLAFLLVNGEMKYMLQRAKLPPGDSGYPLLGHLPILIRDPYQTMLNHNKKYGCPCTINLLMQPVVNLGVDSEEDAAWFATQERKGNLVADGIPHIRALIGRDIIMFSSGKHHHRLRKIFDPAYSPHVLKNYVQLMDGIVQSRLEKMANVEGFQNHNQWSVLAIKVFCACTFGEDFAADDAKLHRIEELYEGYTAGISFPFRFPGSPLSKSHQYKKKLDDVIKGMVEDFQTQYAPDSPEAGRTVMGRLCYGEDEEGNRLTLEQLVANIRFLMFAGHDTLKGTYSAFLKYLVQNPDVHQALLEEVQEWTTLDSATLKEAPLVNAFLLETWRMAAPIHAHPAQAAVDLDYKEYHIPAGTGVALAIQNYNRSNTTRFPSPEKFEIGRYVPPGHKLHDPYLYEAANKSQPKFRSFNVGPHSCLGVHFAKLEAAIVLTRLIQNYDIQIRNERLKRVPMRQIELEFRLTTKKQQAD